MDFYYSEKSKIAEKLAHIQTELKAPKNQFNKFGNYSYRNVEDILEGVKPLLLKYGVTLFLTDSIEVIGEEKYLKATACITDFENGGHISNTAYAKESTEAKGMTPAQITGSCSSYARKYALGGLLLIDDNKDDDSNESQTERNAKAKEKADEKKAEDVKQMNIGEAKVRALIAKAEKDGVDIKKLCAAYKVEKLYDITEAKFNNIVEHWKDIVEKLK